MNTKLIFSIMILLNVPSIFAMQKEKAGKALVQAIKNNKLKELEEVFCSDYTPLPASLRESDCKHWLIKCNVNVNMQIGKEGYSLLHFAAIFRKPDCMQLLINNGADVNIQDEKGDTPMHVAVQSGRAEVVKYLLQFKPDLTFKNKCRKTAIELSVGRNNSKILKYVFFKSAFICPEDLLSAAISKNDIEGVKSLILQRPELLNVKMIKNLIKNNLASYFEIKNTLLSLSIYLNKNCACSLLIDQGVNIEKILGKKGKTPLHWAVEQEKSFCRQLLIDKGAKVDARDEEGNTPLHSAVVAGCLYSAQLLLSNGAKMNIKDNNGNTPLHSSVVAGRSDFVELLIDWGADVNESNNSGETPLYSALIGKKPACRRLLCENGNAKVSWY